MKDMKDPMGKMWSVSVILSSKMKGHWGVISLFLMPVCIHKDIHTFADHPSTSSHVPNAMVQSSFSPKSVLLH